jgi:hypothetical protein
MGQILSVNKLPEDLYNNLIEMLNDPGLTQAFIVEEINAKAGKQLISRTSLNRFIQKLEKNKGTKRRAIHPTPVESLARIATALERIANSLEKLPKKQG